MSANRAELRTRLRQQLRDEDPAAYVWPDAVLDRHLQAALEELDRASPQLASLTTVVPPNPRRLVLFADVGAAFLWLEAIEYPLDRHPRAFLPFREDPGPTADLLTASLPVPGDRLRVWYAARYVLDEAVSDVPAALEHPLVLGAALEACRDQAIDLIPQTALPDAATLYRRMAEHFAPRWEAALRQLAAGQVHPLWSVAWEAGADGRPI